VTGWKAVRIPRGKKLGLPHQSLNQQTAEQFGLDPSPAGLFVVFGQASQSEQAFEVLEAEFDLPANSVQLQDLAGTLHLLTDGRIGVT